MQHALRKHSTDEARPSGPGHDTGPPLGCCAVVMDQQIQLLLAAWREVGRHLDLHDSLPFFHDLLDKERAIEGLALYQDHGPRHALQRMAATGKGRELPDTLVGSAWHAWLDRMLLQGMATGEAPGELQTPVSAYLGLLPDAQGLAGLVVVLARHPMSDEHHVLFETLLEPLGAALANHGRLAHMETLRQAAEADRSALLSRLGRESLSVPVIGAAGGLAQVMERVDLVAPSDLTVLLLGETGSGKEVIGRAVHERSARARGPFLRVNCGAITPELIDSELFGHEKGSFTGALAARQGWFERAHGGTLFLDEIGELPLSAQVRLLRVLQDGTLHRLGGERELHVDVRVVAATHRHLERMVEEGAFREDLWYRIATFPIAIPPLRQRLDDLPALAEHIARRASQRLGLALQLPSAADLELLCRYPWPGNVRELIAVIERAAVLGGGQGLRLDLALGSSPDRVAMPASSNSAQTPHPQDSSARQESQPLSTLESAMRHHIETALAHAGGRIEGPGGAAHRLAINPHTLRSRMRKLGIDAAAFRLSPRGVP